MQNHARFTLAAGVHYESLGAGEDGVLLSIESGYLYRCNYTAVTMLGLLEQGATFEETVTEMSSRFAAEPQQVRGDVAQLLDSLLAERILAEAA
jgi:hypothetical protein